MTLSAFKKGYWPDADPEKRFEQKKGRPFRLIGLPKNSRFYDKTFSSLDESDRERLDNTIINVIFIEQRKPKDNHNSAFHMFERLNSSAKPLQAQEMLNALYAGSFQEHLYKLTQGELWAKMFGKPHRRAKDQELILRFLSLRHCEKEYKPPMKLFLRNFMIKYQNASNTTLSKFSKEFNGTLDRIHKALGEEAFRPYEKSRLFSATYFDAFMVAVASNEGASTEDIVHSYNSLKDNEKFERYTLAATSDAIAVQSRINLVREALNDRS